MLWYKLKTWHGGEETLVKEIRRSVPPYLYNDVFVIYNERNLRRQQQNRIRFFPAVSSLLVRRRTPCSGGWRRSQPYGG